VKSVSFSRLEGKTAVITGASSGMGRVACRMFCEEGASVIGADVDEEGGKSLETELRAAGLPFAFVRCDVTSATDVAALAVYVRETFGRLDVLYNNAGIVIGRPLLEISDEEWDLVLGVNLKGAFRMMRELVPLMGMGSSIVNIASGFGLIGGANLAAYCSSKGGLVLLTKSAALELGPDIRVNAICPGMIDTPMPHRSVEDLPPDERTSTLDSLLETHVARRMGRPEEVVALGVFLASDESSFITGAAIPVDSGVTAA
jgi:NAD(P)-dependent dehydrogenase (short-subunit alcohol dehydrogenase family)